MSERYVIEVDGLKNIFATRRPVWSADRRASRGGRHQLSVRAPFLARWASPAAVNHRRPDLLGLYEKSAGSVKFHGQELADLTAPALRAIRPEMQLVFRTPIAR